MPFDALASSYARARPGYPQATLTAIVAAIQRARPSTPSPDGTVVDVGAGTGISTRALAEALGPSFAIVGVEPSEGMRRQAEAMTAMANVSYLNGTAEQLPIAEGGAIAVVAAQAVQWFDRPRFYAETRRVLERDGILALVQNNRAWQRDAFLEAYEQLLERESPGYSRFYRAFDLMGELTALDGFATPISTTVSWTREMRTSDFVEMTKSSTKMDAVVARHGEEKAASMVRALVAGAFGDEHSDVTIPYDTELFLTRRT